MKRGDIYRVYKGNPYNSKKYRLFVVISRQILIDSKFSTVICAPVYSRYDGLSTQIKIDIEEGTKHFTSPVGAEYLLRNISLLRSSGRMRYFLLQI
ncbi:MAG: hypothetical protein BWK80_21015 [Desulfobacteraceae bacterium IS3]|nr:MAG: hypothetical protein BWK80_21015 [Desulfobacteraceae bacterium IS3]